MAPLGPLPKITQLALGGGVNATRPLDEEVILIYSDPNKYRLGHRMTLGAGGYSSLSQEYCLIKSSLPRGGVSKRMKDQIDRFLNRQPRNHMLMLRC
jgi:hypothetical protein